jgi:methyl-accepting chemotaxis protein
MARRVTAMADLAAAADNPGKARAPGCGATSTEIELDAMERAEELGHLIAQLATLIEKQARSIEMLQAQLEAVTSIVQASIPELARSTEVKSNLAAVHNARMAIRLNNTISENFIDLYQEHLRALLPSPLRDIVD